MSEFQKHIFDFFFELLKSHNLQPTQHNDWVTVAGNFPAFRAFYDKPPEENTSGALSVQVMLDEASLIEETFAALDDSHIEAIKGALGQFSISMFHPIICACCNYTIDEHVTKESWKLKMFSRVETWSGNIALRSSANVDVKTPTDWLTSVSSALKRAKIKKGYNWITLYCSRLNSDPLIASATLNNSEWPDGLKATKSLAWPKIEGFYGARLFILIEN